MDNNIQQDGLRFKSLADISPAGIFLTDCSGSCTYVNQSWMDLSGLSAAQADEYGWANALHPDDRTRVLADWDKAVQNDAVFNFDFRFQKPNGECVWISGLSSPYRDEADVQIGFVGLCFDIGKQKALQIEIDNANRLFRKAEQIAQIGTWRLDVSSDQLFWSEQVFAIHGLPNGPVAPLLEVLELYPEDDKAQFFRAIKQSIESHHPFDLEASFLTTNNQRKRIRNIGEPQFENGKLTSIIGVCQDVTDKFQLEEKLRLAAHLDDLTGIANRKMFVETIQRITNQNELSGEGENGVVLMLIDLDDFKRVNDDLGHPAGDALLIQVADRLSAVAGTELVARIGGDEFAVVKRMEGGDLHCDKTVQEIQACFAQSFTIGSRQVKCSASIGWTTGRAGEKSEAMLSKEADIALYRSKKIQPRSPIMFNEDIGRTHERYTKLANDLKSALSNGQMYLLFQPQMDIESNKVKSFEALLRWDHPDLGQVSPTELIPIAEETGIIGSLGDWVVAEACRHAASWPEDINVSVNVSAMQLVEPEFIAKVMRTLATHQFDPRRLELEITESVFIANIDKTTKMLEKLRDYGVRIALDDFGTGFSSLSYLCAIPFDTVKIDRSFVAQIGVLEGVAPIISAVTGLGAALNFQTVAEGVENTSELAFLKEKGCNHIQGFLISEPISSRSVQKFLGLEKRQTING